MLNHSSKLSEYVGLLSKMVEAGYFNVAITVHFLLFNNA